MAEKPTLFVCHGDEGGPRMHPCRRVQEALNEAHIDYEKVIAAHGNPLPFLRKGSREELRTATGDTKLPTLMTADGAVIRHSRAILKWIAEQKPAAQA
jgi:glutathione S-transferase